jgi:beta-mannanase
MVRFAHEMNLAGSPYGPGQNGNTPALFIAAWRHVVTVFRQQGATNVSWVWSPNVNCGGSCPFQAFYPGDQWVDWVGLDGYNYASVDDVPWMTFQQVFGSSYAELTALTSKPLMIAETASTELGGSKATWIEQTFAQIPTSFPHIKAIVWFDIDKETDWPVNSSPTSLAAYRQVVTSPNYRGTLAVG